MKIYSVGPDDDAVDENTIKYSFREDVGVEFVVYWYEAGSYEGSGTAYLKDSTGNWWTRSLGHCSCYDPWDSDSGGWDIVYYEEMMNIHLSKESYNSSETTAIRNKILELTNV